MKKILKIIFLILVPIYLFGHELIMNITDNKNDTVTVNGKFNTGEDITGALLQLKSTISNEVLFEKRFLSNNEITFDIPKIPYQIILIDESDGDEIVKAGIPPKEGFKDTEKIKPKENPNKEQRPSRNMMQISSSMAVTVSIILAFILLLATIIVSIKNTNKLINELQNK
jgi:hypothetical protein